MIVRQKPPTASGVVFLTLEDETGLVNLIVWPDVWDRYRRLARAASLLGIDGILQRSGNGPVSGGPRRNEAIDVVVKGMWGVPPARSSRDPELSAPEPPSRDFH